MAPKRTTRGGKNESSAGSRKKAPASKKTASRKAASPKPAGAKKRAGGAAAEAERLIAEPDANHQVAAYGSQLLDSRSTTATQAARVLSEVISRKPELVVGLVDKFVKGLRSKHKRVVQASAEALPAVAKVSPARVARHLDTLKSSFDSLSEEGKDGLVRTFANLCSASVAYQKRLEPVLTKALHQAQGKTLLAWTEAVLPALKGEPHARARSVVEARLYKVPRSVAQPIADFLGVKLRPNTR
ncbi:MAG: hypothetical protein ACODAU_01010 [Myxococcota bacterium]